MTWHDINTRIMERAARVAIGVEELKSCWCSQDSGSTSILQQLIVRLPERTDPEGHSIARGIDRYR
jgi:hypothetical protein